jgi:hypothetical protein
MPGLSTRTHSVEVETLNPHPRRRTLQLIVSRVCLALVLPTTTVASVSIAASAR